MNVLYDLSVAGMGYTNPKARTGIFRVVESLFLELVKQDGIDLSAIALHQQSNIWADLSTELYLQQYQPQLQSYFQSGYASRLHLQSLYKTGIKTQRSLIHASFQNRSFLYKLAIALQIPFKLLAKLDAPLALNPQKFKIYHSTFFPLPQNSKFNQIPKVLTIYDMIPVLHPEFFTAKIHRRFVTTLNSIDYKKDWIICISESTKNDFCNYTGMNPERVFVTPLAASEYFHPVIDQGAIAATLQRYGIPSSPYLLSLSTLEPRKNLGFLIRCFAQLFQEHPSLDINLVLVGVSGWKNADIFQAVEQHPQLKSRIFFTGYVPDADLSAIYSGALAFVYPSLYEGFGLPPLEAMQCGIPVITSNTSSLPEVVGDAGILINPRQPDELCQAMLNLMQNSQLRNQLSERSRQQAQNFSWARCATDTIEVYRAALSA